MHSKYCPEAILAFFQATQPNNDNAQLESAVVVQEPSGNPAVLIYFGDFADIVAFAN
mgnify:CR=1 FL=1